LLVLPALVLAQDIPNYTDKHVNDFAGVFSVEQASELRAIFSQVDQNTTAEMTVLTVDTQGGQGQRAAHTLRKGHAEDMGADGLRA
jgi:uncharacterized membrane protein YgcG